MVNITFWKGGGKMPNSTAHPGGESGEMACQITEGCSVLTPRIILSGMHPDINYAYIPDFGRYYSVVDCRVNKSQTVIDLTVDVLHTYKTAIGATSAYIARSASAYNRNIIDTSAPIIPGTGKLSFVDTSPFVGETFLVQVVGVGGCKMYQLTTASFTALCSALWNAWNNIEGIDDLYASVLNPFQYIISVQKCWAAYGAFGTAAENLILGTMATGIAGYNVTDGKAVATRTITVPKHPGASIRPYLKSSAFSSYSLYVPGAGWIALDAADLYNADTIGLQFFYEPNSCNMRCDVVVDGACIAAAAGKIGVNWGIGASSIDVLGMAGGIVDTAAGVFDMVKSGASAIPSFVNSAIATAKAAVPTVQTSGGVTGAVGITEQCELLLKYQNQATVNTYGYGEPLMETRAINTLSGFVLCAESDFGAAPTMDENRAINAYMTGGFYYE